jgi:hypothetical protein
LLRSLLGHYDPAVADRDSIRGYFGVDSLAIARSQNRLIDNLIHTSDDPGAARRDFLIWFGGDRTDLLHPLTRPGGTAMTVTPSATNPAQVRYSSGPDRLTLMPADQIDALDPYMAQIITYRKSGLSLNHIIGCPLNCGYCVRHFWGDFEHKTPHLLCPTDEAISLLLGHEAFQPTTPIQLFNKATDPFLPAVKSHLFQVLRALDERGRTTWS